MLWKTHEKEIIIDYIQTSKLPAIIYNPFFSYSLSSMIRVVLAWYKIDASMVQSKDSPVYFAFSDFVLRVTLQSSNSPSIFLHHIWHHSCKTWGGRTTLQLTANQVPSGGTQWLKLMVLLSSTRVWTRVKVLEALSPQQFKNKK